MFLACSVAVSSRIAVPVESGNSDPALISAADRRLAEQVSVVTILPPGTSTFGVIRATSCQKLMHDPEPADDLAMTMLKIEAAKLGANALYKPKVARLNVSITANCWTTMKGVATAVLLPR